MDYDLYIRVAWSCFLPNTSNRRHRSDLILFTK